MLEGYYVKKIGQNRGAPRVWLEGAQATRAGFKPGHRYDVHIHGHTIELQANPDGTRVVSSKKTNSGANPVIDLNSRELLAIFDGMSAVRVMVRLGSIYISPLATEIKKRERFKTLREKLERGEPLAIGSLSHGGGLMANALHRGLEEAGVPSRLLFANDIREDLLEHAGVHNDAWNDSTVPYAVPLQELAFDERGVAELPKLEVLEMGLPCEASSKSGIAKRQLRHPESHPSVGHLVVGALVILSKTNAAIVVLENVQNYAHTASASILRNQLRDLGYVTHERVLNGKAWGALENRDRWFMVAVTEGIAFNFDQLRPPPAPSRTLSDVLEDIPPDDPRWSKMEGLRQKEARDLAAGKNFKMRIYNGESDEIGCLTKGYSKVRSTDPKIQSESNPEMLRQLTVAEHAAVKSVPPHLVEGLSNTVGHEVLGQGVVFQHPNAVGKHIGEALARMMGRMVESDRPDANDLVDLAAQVVSSINISDETKGRYSGRITAVDRGVVIQDIGRNEGVLHRADALDTVPKLGQKATIEYSNGRGKTIVKRERQLSLEI